MLAPVITVHAQPRLGILLGEENKLDRTPTRYRSDCNVQAGDTLWRLR